MNRAAEQNCPKCGGSGSYREDRGDDKDPWLNYCECPLGDELRANNNANSEVTGE